MRRTGRHTVGQPCRLPRYLFAIGLSVLLVAAAAGCGSVATNSSSSSSSSTQTLTLVQTGDVASFGFDPSSQPDPELPVLMNLFDTLTRETSKLAPQPDLASSWQFNSTYTELTLKLRPGLKFSNGTPLTAAAVIWNIQRYQNPATGAAIGPLLSNISAVTASGSSEVVIHFSVPDPTIFDALEFLFITGEQSAQQLKTNPIGTGPFRVTQDVPGDHVTLSANPYYWQGLPKLKSIVVRPVSDPEAQVVDLRTGAADVIWDPAYTDAALLKNTAGLSVEVGAPASVIVDILLNTRRAPFDNGLVRQAISLALDRQAYVKVATDNQSPAMCMPWLPTSPAYDASLASCPPNIAKAKQLLAAAGYPNGFSTTMGTYQESWSTDLGQIVKADLAEIGVTVTIDEVQDAVAESTITAGSYDMWAHDYGRATQDPYTLLDSTIAWKPTGVTGYDTPGYVSLIKQIGETTNQTVRGPLFQQLNQLIVTQPWVITVAPLVEEVAYTTKLSGFTFNVQGMLDLADASLS